jgi:hypothetical protein
MLKLKQLLFLTFIILFLSCNNKSSYTYAIKDFRKSLQPHLIKLVSKGIVMGFDSSLRNMVTDRELLQLSQSENSVLRASAFKEILNRKSFNHFDIIMNHLDDTAIVAMDAGEFGIWFRTVSDYILQEAAGWNTQEAKNKTIDQVLTRHNYLRSAYLILAQIDPQEKYYPFIKEMATRPSSISENLDQIPFYDIEYALCGLAKFKKKEDVQFIKNQLMKNVWRLSDLSFRLMKEFPDTAYLDVLQAYHRRNFYRFSGDGKNGFTGNFDNRASSEDFIEALVVQQNEKSAQILDTILQRLSSMTCVPHKEYIEDEVVSQIWEHPNPAYEKLRDRIKGKAEELMKGQIDVPINRPNEPIDTTQENIRWQP